MKTKFLALLALLTMAPLAHAKITVFNSADALQAVLTSEGFINALHDPMEMQRIDVEVKGEGAAKSFQFVIQANTPNNPWGPCTAIFTVDTVIVNHGGITASELGAPKKVQGFVCLE